MNLRFLSVRRLGVANQTQLLVALTLLMAMCCAQSQTVTATLPFDNFPRAVAMNPVANRIYVANGGAVTVIDGATSSLEPSDNLTAV